MDEKTCKHENWSVVYKASCIACCINYFKPIALLVV